MEEEGVFDQYLRTEVNFLHERIEILEEIIESQRNLIYAYEKRDEHMKTELNDVLGNP